MLQLTITFDSQTIDLQAQGSAVLDGYFPATASAGAESVTERIDLLNIQPNSAELEIWIHTLEQAFDYARKHRSGPQAVYLNFAIEQGVDTWRARIFDGQVLYDGKLTQRWREHKVKVGLVIERTPYWDGPEVAVPVSNGNGTDITTGINVYNCNDGVGSAPNKRHNYVEIVAGQIEGDLPAPARIEMVNLFNSTSRLYNIYISHNVYANPSTLNHILEGENAQYGTVGSNASYSGGSIKSWTWSGDNQVNVARFELSQELLAACAGQYFKLLANFGFAPYSVKLQAKITFPAGTPLSVLDTGPEVTIGNYQLLQEIGTVQIPPWLPGETELAPVDLSIYARAVPANPYRSLTIDFIQLSPLDSYRILTPRGYGAAYTIRVVDDGIDGTIWTDGWSPAGKTGHYIGMGEPVKLIPGRAQRLYFLQTGDTSGSGITRQLAVKLYYRPRRRGL